MSGRDDGLVEAQHRHWQATYTEHPGMYGDAPSEPARYAATLFAAAGATEVLELGAGHGRDTLHLARAGLHVQATDFSSTALAQLRQQAAAAGLTASINTIAHDIRQPLPLPDASVDAVYAHMLLCMALTTQQIAAATDEVQRVLRPGGIFVYTVRHTGDAHYRTGVDHGDNIYEQGGFAVHFFDRALVDRLSQGWRLTDLHPFEEGELPRRLWRITQTVPAARP